MSARRGIKSAGTPYRTPMALQQPRKRNWVSVLSFCNAGFLPPPPPAPFMWNASFLDKKKILSLDIWYTKEVPVCFVEVLSNSLRNANLFCIWFTWSGCKLWQFNNRWRGDEGVTVLLLQTRTLVCLVCCSLGKGSAVLCGVAVENHITRLAHLVPCEVFQRWRLLPCGSFYSRRRMISSFWWWCVLVFLLKCTKQ